MSETFTVRVSKDYLVFCCAHFITYERSTCERLHGHNYRASAEVVGPLDENRYVFDFIALKNMLREITDELDHHMLLPTESRLIRVTEEGQSVRVKFQDREWLFPREDCVLLAIENTTAELLARWIGERLEEKLRARGGNRLSLIRVEVEESFGQSAVCELRDL